MTYKIGTICVGCNFIDEPIRFRNGMECEIIGGLEERTGFSVSSTQLEKGMCYYVRWADGTERGVRPENLRPRKPPFREIDKVVSWGDCLWQPSHIREEVSV